MRIASYVSSRSQLAASRRRSSRYDLRHDVEADRADALPHRVGELVVVAEQVQPRPHRREHVVDAPSCRRRCAGPPDRTGAAPRASGTRRCPSAPCTPGLRRARNAGACRRGSCRASATPPTSCAPSTAAAPRPACGTSSARTCRRAPRPATARPVRAAVGQVVQRRRRRLARHRRARCTSKSSLLPLIQ